MNSETQNIIAVQLAEINQIYGQNLAYQKDRIVNEAKFFMAQSATSMLEAGQRLVLLKENEPHGDFTRILEEDLNLSPRTAQRLMQTAIKFTSLGKQKAQSFAQLGSTKLFELLTTEDEDLEELAAGGTVAGLTLDEIDKMSTRDLKKALREAREDKDAIDRTLSDKNKKIDDLSVKLEKKVAKLKLEDNTAAEELRASFQATWGEVVGKTMSGIYHARQVVEQATAEEVDLPYAFMQNLTLNVAEMRDQLNEMLLLLPSDTGPLDASWLKDDPEETAKED